MCRAHSILLSRHPLSPAGLELAIANGPELLIPVSACQVVGLQGICQLSWL